MRLEIEMPEMTHPEWIRPEPIRSRFFSRFNDFFPDETGGNG